MLRVFDFAAFGNSFEWSDFLGSIEVTYFPPDEPVKRYWSDAMEFCQYYLTYKYQSKGRLLGEKDKPTIAVGFNSQEMHQILFDKHLSKSAFPHLGFVRRVKMELGMEVAAFPDIKLPRYSLFDGWNKNQPDLKVTLYGMLDVTNGLRHLVNDSGRPFICSKYSTVESDNEQLLNSSGIQFVN